MSKIQWQPLESNPEVFNDFLTKLGVKGTKCVDVYGFDDELIDMIPKPHLALILCYPEYKKVDKLMKPIYDKAEAEGAKIPDGAFFMKQTISMACGTYALFHALTQNKDKIDFGDGSFAEWYKVARDQSPVERSKSLSKSSSVATAHDVCATSGDTDANPDKVEHHYITYVNFNGRLYEFDGEHEFPRECGPTTQETLVKDAGREFQRLSAELKNHSFSALALVGESQ